LTDTFFFFLAWKSPNTSYLAEGYLHVSFDKPKLSVPGHGGFPAMKHSKNHSRVSHLKKMEINPLKWVGDASKQVDQWVKSAEKEKLWEEMDEATRGLSRESALEELKRSKKRLRELKDRE
jgi:hypothetical protein